MYEFTCLLTSELFMFAAITLNQLQRYCAAVINCNLFVVPFAMKGVLFNSAAVCAVHFLQIRTFEL
jgi:hypothetical protein